MSRAVEYFLERARRRAEYFERYLEYCRLIKRKVEERWGPVRVVVFGSVVRGDYNPALSDIDVLVVTPWEPSPRERAAIICYVKNKVLKDPAAPFEVHVASEREYREWYSRFIDVMKEVE